MKKIITIIFLLMLLPGIPALSAPGSLETPTAEPGGTLPPHPTVIYLPIIKVEK